MSDRPPEPPDPARRRFFRQFAGDVVSSVGTVLGAAQALQQQSADAAREMLAGDAPPAAPSVPSVAGTQVSGTTLVAGQPSDASTAGFRAPFRWDGDVCWVVDQRRLPDTLADIEVRGAADAVTAINDGAITGGAVQAQLAAVTLALVAGHTVASRGFARRATIRGAANALRLTRPGSAAVGSTIDRILALLDTFDNAASGEAVERAIRAEAEAVIAEASADHGALVGHALGLLPGDPDAPLRVLTAGNAGAMGGGQFGTAVSTIITVHHAGRPVHALVAETRPHLEGARVATWELEQAGVPHALVTDAAAPAELREGDVAAVLVTAERVTANGDVIATAGTYPLALAAHEAAIPFLVLVATTAVDLATADAAAAPMEAGRPGPVLFATGTRIAPERTPIRNPRLDRTPAGLVTAIVTEEGVARAPYAEELHAFVRAAERRRAASPGYAALLEARAASAGAAAAGTMEAAAAGTPAQLHAATTAEPAAGGTAAAGTAAEPHAATSPRDAA